MSFTTEQMRLIQDRLAGERNVLPPLDVVRAVAVLIGKDNLSEVICNSQQDEKSTTWRVVGLLDSECLFTMEAFGGEHDWDAGTHKDAEGRVQVQLSACIRSLSDVSSLILTRATAPGYEQARALGLSAGQAEKPWDIEATWEILWRDGSPSLALLARTDAMTGERAAAEAIVDKVRQVLAAR
ncbi:MAG TPA: hypothetical protein VIJ07_14035 [Dermatophilaceae bacterium]